MKGLWMIEVFETEDGLIGVSWKLGFNDAGLEVFDDPDEAWRFVENLGADMELCYYEEETTDG